MPPALVDALREFRPGDEARHTARDLLAGQLTRHQLEFDVAEDVCERLAAVDQRVSLVAFLATFLAGYRPSPTAIKYFRRATTLYLAGYDAEAVIMAGAVLDAALAERVPNGQLRAAGLRPTFPRTGDYSVSARLRFARERGLLPDAVHEHARPVLNWRNDAVHVQPDIAGQPAAALGHLALILPLLFPGEGPVEGLAGA